MPTGHHITNGCTGQICAVTFCAERCTKAAIKNSRGEPGVRGLMYGIPKDLNLDVMVGSECTQVRVGQFDVQFSFGEIDFNVQSKISLCKHGTEIGVWEEGKWPDDAFYKIINVPVESVQIQNSKIIVISLEKGISIHLSDDSEQFETMKITIRGEDPWII